MAVSPEKKIELDSYDYLFTFLVCLIACIILFGNFLVVLSIKKFTYLQTPTNIYILFLAISDLLVGFSLPYTAAFILKREDWRSSEFNCLLRYFFLTYGGGTSVLLLLGE